MKWGFPALPAAVALAVLATPARAAVHRVPSEFTTIQAGVNACAVGDTVLVAPGIYAGPGNRGITISGIDIVVRSEAGSGVTVIDAEQEDRAFMLIGPMSGGTRIEGFTIRNGEGESDGGGIWSIDASPTLADLLILDCQCRPEYCGGGASFYHGSPAFVDVEINNGWAVRGGGINYVGSGHLQFSRVRFHENGADAIYCSGASRIDIVDSEFVANLFGSHIENAGTCRIAGTLFAEEYRGLFVESDSCEVIDCTFSENYGEDIQFGGGDLRLEGSTLFGNHSTTGFGGAVRLISPQSAAIARTLISNVVGIGVLWDGQGETPAFECCNIYRCDGGNTSDNLDDPTGENGNISEYPFFCGSDGQGEPFSLEVRENSPCLPENNSCGVQIGAYGCGCPAVTAAEAAGARGPRLFPVHPNPFNPRTTIAFELPKAMPVTLRILDVAGRVVVNLIESRFLPAGRHEISWDGRDGAGIAAASGIYLCRLETEGHRQTAKLTLLR